MNKLEILEEVHHNKRWMYKVRCSCGKVEVKRKDWVKSGRTTSCKSCSCKLTAKLSLPIVLQSFLQTK